MDAIVLLLTLVVMPTCLCVPNVNVLELPTSFQMNTNYSDPLYSYSRPGFSIYGAECVGDCIAGICVTTRKGDVERCRIKEDQAPRVYYTSRYKHPTYTKCTSACVQTASWCFVNNRGDWDYCNPLVRTSADAHPDVVRVVENVAPQTCRTPCTYKKSSGRYECKTRETWEMCAPFADEAPPVLPAVIDRTANSLAVCISQPKLRNSSRCLIRRKRMDESDSDYEDSACRAADHPDYIDTYRVPDAYGMFNNAQPGTVVNDAAAYRATGELHSDPAPPLTSYTTVRNTELNIDLPVVVRARINAAALDAAVTPRPGGAIEAAVPSLLDALRRIRYTANGIAYDVGHMVAYLSNGPDADFNFAPQTATLNRGLWLSMERHIRTWVNDGRPFAFVDMLIVIYYDPGVRYLPLAFGVNLAYFYTEGQVASLCNDMLYFNHNNRNRRTRSIENDSTY